MWDIIEYKYIKYDNWSHVTQAFESSCLRLKLAIVTSFPHFSSFSLGCSVYIIHVPSYNQPHYQYEQESIIPPSTSKTQTKPEPKAKTMSFEPKQKVDLDPPKDDIITLEYLSKCDGEF